VDAVGGLAVCAAVVIVTALGMIHHAVVSHAVFGQSFTNPWYFMTALPFLFVLLVRGLEAIDRRVASVGAAGLAVLFVAIDLHGAWIQMPRFYASTTDAVLQWSRLTSIHPAILSGDLRWLFLATQLGALCLVIAGLAYGMAASRGSASSPRRRIYLDRLDSAVDGRCAGADDLLHLAGGMGRNTYVSALAPLAGAVITSCATFGMGGATVPEVSNDRKSVLATAQVWQPTNIRTMDLKTGPQETGAFPSRATVLCNYLDKPLGGQSPKFACTIGEDDEVKVKFGGNNGEVYGEVLATRLLWALGFGADRMYPVNVICRGCPPELGGIARPDNARRFDPAVIERTMPGTEWPAAGQEGWSWGELDFVNAELGGAPPAHRDALKLMAVFLQHTDSKPEQQRVICGGRATPTSCERPFLMISDVGLTFGRANRANANSAGSVNLNAWRQTPVWTGDAGCTGNLPKSFSGTLDNPAISEEGRRFLANLLVQLSDAQIHALFEVARVELRLRSPGEVSSGFATVPEWVDAFKEKRNQIVQRRCTQAPEPRQA
jgi:hypothetical protein